MPPKKKTEFLILIPVDNTFEIAHVELHRNNVAFVTIAGFKVIYHHFNGRLFLRYSPQFTFEELKKFPNNIEL